MHYGILLLGVIGVDIEKHDLQTVTPLAVWTLSRPCTAPLCASAVASTYNASALTYRARSRATASMPAMSIASVGEEHNTNSSEPIEMRYGPGLCTRLCLPNVLVSLRIKIYDTVCWPCTGHVLCCLLAPRFVCSDIPTIILGTSLHLLSASRRGGCRVVSVDFRFCLLVVSLSSVVFAFTLLMFSLAVARRYWIIQHLPS